MFWLLASVGLLALIAALAYFFPSWALQALHYALGKAWEVLKPRFLKTFSPKNFTPEQISKIRRGENPFHDKGKQ